LADFAPPSGLVRGRLSPPYVSRGRFWVVSPRIPPDIVELSQTFLMKPFFSGCWGPIQCLFLPVFFYVRGRPPLFAVLTFFVFTPPPPFFLARHPKKKSLTSDRAGVTLPPYSFFPHATGCTPLYFNKCISGVPDFLLFTVMTFFAFPPLVLGREACRAPVESFFF